MIRITETLTEMPRRSLWKRACRETKYIFSTPGYIGALVAIFAGGALIAWAKFMWWAQ